MSNILLIDSNNLLHRVYWVSKNRATNTSVYYLFLNSIKKYYDMFSPSQVYCVWDKRLLEGKNFRHELSQGDYKKTRDKERNAEVYKCESTVSQLTASLGIKNIYPGVLEGDDVIYWLTRKLPDKRKIIISVDQDFIQLVDDTTKIYSPIKDIIITHNNFKDILNLTMDEFIHHKALVGDKSDNIIGLEGVGPARALKLVQSTDSLKNILTEEQYNQYSNNLQLIALSNGIKHHPGEEDIYDKQYQDLQSLDPDFDKFKELCNTYNIKQILDNFSSWKDVFNKNDFINRLTKFIESAK
jgi:DNA polymerase I